MMGVGGGCRGGAGGDGWGKKWKWGEEKGEGRRGVGLCDWVSGIGSVWWCPVAWVTGKGCRVGCGWGWG